MWCNKWSQHEFVKVKVDDDMMKTIIITAHILAILLQHQNEQFLPLLLVYRWYLAVFDFIVVLQNEERKKWMLWWFLECLSETETSKYIHRSIASFRQAGSQSGYSIHFDFIVIPTKHTNKKISDKFIINDVDSNDNNNNNKW